MADKSIGDLTRATYLDGESLLVVEQSGEARSVAGAIIAGFAREVVADDVQRAVDAAYAAEQAADGVENYAQAAAQSELNAAQSANTAASHEAAALVAKVNAEAALSAAEKAATDAATDAVAAAGAQLAQHVSDARSARDDAQAAQAAAEKARDDAQAFVGTDYASIQYVDSKIDEIAADLNGANIFQGDEEPDDEKICVWIDTDDDADAAITPASIGAVNKSGDTMTGNLVVEKNTPILRLRDTAVGSEGTLYNTNDRLYLQVMNDSGTDKNRRQLQLIDSDIRGINEAFCLVDIVEGNATGYTILHTGNAYTKAETDAAIAAATSSLGGFTYGDTAPTNTKLLWIDTSSNGVMKYHNGTEWVTVTAAWQ